MRWFRNFIRRFEHAVFRDSYISALVYRCVLNAKCILLNKGKNLESLRESMTSDFLELASVMKI